MFYEELTLEAGGVEQQQARRQRRIERRPFAELPGVPGDLPGHLLARPAGVVHQLRQRADEEFAPAVRQRRPIAALSLLLQHRADRERGRAAQRGVLLQRQRFGRSGILGGGGRGKGECGKREAKGHAYAPSRGKLNRARAEAKKAKSRGECRANPLAGKRKRQLESPVNYPDLHLLIGSEKVSGGGRETEDVIDPATGETIGTLPHANAEDLDRALDNASRGFRQWRGTPADQRAAILTKAAGLIKERAGEIGQALTREQGKPVKEGVGETIYSAMLLEFYAGEIKRIYGRTLVRPAGQRVEVQYHPVGPVAGFAAWNFPALNVMRKIGGALAAGCSVIVKPSEETPAAGIALVQALIDAGVPGDAVQCVFGVPDTVSRHLLGSSIVRKLTFTGSTAVGKHLAKLAAEDLKICTLELGGHSPVLVFNDSDIDAVLDTMVAAKYRNAGQVCVSPTRFLIEEDVFERFRDGFVERAKKVKVGSGFDDDTQTGPMANSRGIDSMEKLLGNAKDKGARLLTGGERIGNRGFFHEPTVLSQVPTDAEIMNHEPFGPVALLNPMKGEESMIEEANRLPYGLAAYAWTQDPARRRRLAAEIEAGMLAINGAAVSAVDAPFGGVKWSGYGSEDGREGVMACMVPKTIHES